MIPINEIRLGNLFLNSQGNIQEITIEHFEYLANPNFYPHDAINPIKLTDTILFKYGFLYVEIETVKPRIYLIKDRLIIKKVSETHFLLACNYAQNGDLSIAFNYVHQLQNLYFCLTGNELQAVS
jgi:hypothetical protein